jgi:hypothetical protein
MQGRNHAEIKVLLLVASLSWGLFIMTGCSGVELGAKAGLYRVDTRQESQRTYDKPGGLKCLFINCNRSNSEEAQGS